jgi:ATP-dependent RNA helicase DDX55/SPB4
MGKSGNAIIFLSKDEDTYIEFLGVKKIPISEYSINNENKQILNNNNNKNYLEVIKKKKLKDRELMENGEKAYISFLRAYSQHKCKYIFKLEKLDFDKIAEGYSLLKVFY